MSRKIIVLVKITHTTYIECMRNYKKQDARDHCANWDAGDCLGCDIRSNSGVLIIYVLLIKNVIILTELSYQE